jgi:L-lactate dehydrogenase complex protein LldE
LRGARQRKIDTIRSCFAAIDKETGIKLFIPCFLDQLAPHVARAVTGLLDRLNVAWDYPEDQTCCGQFAWTVGDAATARRLMRHFLRVFAGAGTILCPSASCTYMVRQCYPQLAEGPGERRAVAALASRVMELSEWLAGWGPLPWTPRFEGPLVLHQSCKARQLGVLAGAREALSQVHGLKLLTVSPCYSCCGFGGTFSLQHPGLSRDIGTAYLAAVSVAGAGGLVSLDYSCLQHLQDLGAAPGRGLRFYHLAEILTMGG